VLLAKIEGLRVETEGSLTIYARELYSPDPNRREEAARQLWLRFSERLVAQVRRRLAPRILRRTGAEDVVQNLFAAFFDADPGPNGPPRNRAELWRRLVHFTMCAVANTVDYHQAQRRDYRRETPIGDMVTDAHDPETQPQEPEDYRVLDPADNVIAQIEFKRLLDMLPPDLRQVFAMRLDGYTNSEIARQIGRVERTVELKMSTIRGLLRPHVVDAPLHADQPEVF
jgi:RNA polymerase sigma factor (sigma-70 family)